MKAGFRNVENNLIEFDEVGNEGMIRMRTSVSAEFIKSSISGIY